MVCKAINIPFYFAKDFNKCKPKNFWTKNKNKSVKTELEMGIFYAALALGSMIRSLEWNFGDYWTIGPIFYTLWKSMHSN